MRNILLTIILLGLILITGCSQKELSEMTSEDWKKDLEYLEKKIRKEFNSFDPTVKDIFQSEIDQVKEQLPEMDQHDIACEIMRLLSILKDGHTELNIAQERVGFHKLPLSLYFFEDELYILAAHENYENLIGGKITEIGQLSTEDAFMKLTGVMSHDNDMEFLHAGPHYLIQTELLECLDIIDDILNVPLTIELQDSSIQETSISALPYESYVSGPWKNYYDINGLERRLYVSKQDSRYWHKYLPENKTMYFNFSRVNNQKGRPSIKKYVNDMFKEIDKERPDKLVIDFRLNNGGNYNKSRPLINNIKKRPWLNQKGKVWVITGRRTFSAASSATIFLIKETEAIIIGEPGRTHPNQADNNEYMNLPNSDFLIEYTTRIKKKWPERPELDRIPVDIEVVPTFQAYTQGIDPVMEYILMKSK